MKSRKESSFPPSSRRRISLARLARRAAIFSLVAMTGCSPALGPTIELKELPPVEQATGAKAGLGRSVSVGSVQDNRAPGDGVTAAGGDVSFLVQKAVSDVLKANGFQLSPGAPVTVVPTIRKWHTKASTTSTVQVNSEAAITVEIVNSQGKRLYSGSYNGNRMATTPVASKNDIRFSLSTAMTEAVNQIVQDPKLIKVLVGK